MQKRKKEVFRHFAEVFYPPEDALWFETKPEP